MGKVFNSKQGGLLTMVLSILGVVLWVTMFYNILTAFYTLSTFATASAYIAWGTVVTIAPTILFIAGIFAGAYGYVRGYQSAAEKGISGFIIMVVGALEIILFVTMFSSIMTAMEIIRTYAHIADFIALQTVVEIAPTVLFLGGLFAGGATVAGGYRKSKKDKAAKAAAF